MGRGLVILFIAAWWINLSSAATFSESDIQWASGASGTLYRGNTLTNDEYMVKAIEFHSPVPGFKDSDGNIVPLSSVEPSVLLEIYKNGTLLRQIVLDLQSDYYIDPDYEVKVSATGFPGKNAREWVFEYYNPWATISIQKRGHPRLDVTIGLDPDKTTYYAGEVITAKVTITNGGDAFAKNVDADLNIDRLRLLSGISGDLHRNYIKIEKGESKDFEVKLDVPDIVDEITINLSASTKSYDMKELEYISAGSKSITASVRLVTIYKAFRDRIYLKDIDVVRITVTNSGMHDAYDIHVNDSVNENFELKPNISLQMDIPLLRPGEESSMTYLIKPIEADINGFTIPAAFARFTVNNKQYIVSTTTSTLVVNGPKLVLNKTVNKSVVNISEDVKVTVSIKNVGNAGTSAVVKDSLPEKVNFLNGSLNLPSTFMEVNIPYGFSYVIQMNEEGNVTLPPCLVNYTDVALSGTIRSKLSSEINEITVINQSTAINQSNVTPTPETSESNESTNKTQPSAQGTGETSMPSEPAPTPMTSGLNIMLAIIVFIIASACMRK